MPGALTSLLLLATLVVVAGLLRDRLGVARAAGAAIAAGMVTTSAVGLALLDLGRLDAATLGWALPGALALVVALALALRRALPPLPAPSPGPAAPVRRQRALAAALALVIAGGVGLRLDPSPYLHGGQDQGIYVNVGHHIARTGRLRPQDPLMAGAVRGVRAEEIRAAYRIERPPEGSPLRGVREGRWIAGIHVEDAGRGLLIPAFFHLLPVWFALAEHAWGFDRATWPLPLFWLLSALAAAALAGRWYRSFEACPDEHTTTRARAAALLAALALALHPLDLWISTFTVSENLARACLLGGAWLALEGAAAAREGRAGGALLAALGGLCLAAGAFARGTLIALAIALAAALVASPAPGRPRRALLIALTAGTTLAALQAIFHAWPYFFSAASNHFHVPRLRPFQGEAAAWAIAAGALVLLIDRALDRARARPRLAARARALAGAAILALTAVAALVLVHQAIAPSNAWGPAQQVLPALVRHGGPLPVLLGLCAVALAARRADDDARPWVALAAVILALTAFKQGIRYEFYYARYLVADAVPLLAVASACLLVHVHKRLSLRTSRARAAAVAGALALAWLLPPLRLLPREVYWTRDLAGGPAQLRALFGQVPDDAILIFDSRAPGRWRGILAVPALLAFGRRVLVYPSNQIVERAIRAGTPIYLLSGGWEAADRQRWLDPEHGPWRTEVVARGVYRAPRAEVVEGGVPARLVDWGGPYELQRFDRSIWRSSGAFTLYRGSAYLTADGAELRSADLEMTWGAATRVELWLRPEAAACPITAHLGGPGVDEVELAPIAGDDPAVRLWSLPGEATAVTRRLRLVAGCDDLRRGWRWLSVRTPG